MNLLQMLAAVIQVQTHGSACAFNVLTQDRLVNPFVLIMNALFITQEVIVEQVRRIKPATRDDDDAEVTQGFNNVGITGCLSYFQMELKVSRGQIIRHDLMLF